MLGQAGHDCIMRSSGFEDFQDRIETKTGIRPHTQFSNIRWYIDEAGCQQFNAAIPCASIAGPQFGIPQIGGVGFQAQQRIIGTLTSVTGIVADLRLLLTPEHRDHTAVEIKDQAGPVLWQVDEILQQSIIHPMQLFQERVASPHPVANKLLLTKSGRGVSDAVNQGEDSGSIPCLKPCRRIPDALAHGWPSVAPGAAKATQKATRNSSELALKLASRLAAIVIVSPVRGLRP
jgi:hypothetical protein